MHIDNKKDILIFGKGVTQGLDDTSLTEEAEYLLILQNVKIHFG